MKYVVLQLRNSDYSYVMMYDIHVVLPMVLF